MLRFFVLVVALALPAWAAATESPPGEAPAQETPRQPSVLVNGHVDSGGFGGFGLVLTRLAGQSGVLIGGHGAWLIDHRLALGGAGFALASDAQRFDTFHQRDEFLEFGYGGLWAGYMLLPYDVVHVSLHGLVGGGAVTYSLRYQTTGSTPPDKGDGFFVGEVGADVVLNVVDFMRFTVGPSWRATGGVHFRDLRDSDLSGPALGFMLDFGKF